MTPYLTVVVGGRNDDYGGNFLGRMQHFVNGIVDAAEGRAQLELVVVDWNPVADAKSLATALDWPPRTRLEIRVIEVPSRIHASLPNAEHMPIFEYIAKNVGIRRARGEYVLATNPDLLFNRAVTQLFRRRRLARGRYYRVERYDVVPEIPAGSHAEQLAFCARNFTRANLWEDTISFPDRLQGLARTPLGVRVAARRRFGTWRRSPASEDPLRRLHTNASGDFLLMHREHWHELRAYPELHTASHIDSYMCAIAASAGLQQTVLPYRYRIYHQEHARAVDFQDLGAITRPLTKYEDYAEDALRMLDARRPSILNDERWGLGDTELEETYVV